MLKEVEEEATESTPAAKSIAISEPMVPDHASLEQTSARGTRIEGMGTVHIRALLSDESTKNTKLTNVLCSRHLKSTRLFSWSYIRDKGCSLWAKGNDLFLLNPDNSRPLWAHVNRGVLEIQIHDEV